MKLTLKFTEGEMMDLQLLARWKEQDFTDDDTLTNIVGALVRAELDKIRQPQTPEGGKP